MGYRLLPAFWGRGLASEGAAALLDHGFRRLDLPKIFAETMAVNTASRAVMSRLGMRHVATRGEGAVGAVEGSAQGVVDYVITHAEWLAGRGRPAAVERGIAQPFTGEQIAGTMVTVGSSDPDWPRQYRSAAADLLAALGARITAIEHIGSTAVPGLVAKPIIDIAARAAPGVDPFSLHDAIDALGYRPHTAGPKNHAVFVKSAGSERSHLLHVFADDQWDTCNQRLFRDKLLHDESARRRYAELKVALASSATDGKQYTAGKRALVEELLHEEQAARGLPSPPPGRNRRQRRCAPSALRNGASPYRGRMRHLLRLDDLRPDDLGALFELADAYRQGAGPTTTGAAALFFPATSLRTRVSFERGAALMGLQPISFPPETLDKPESLDDVAGYLAAWVDVLVVRHPDLRVLEGLAESDAIPIVNAMTDDNHPCEVLSDLYALAQTRDPRRLRFLFVGADGNIARAWAEAARAFDLDLVQCCPERLATAGVAWTDDLPSAVARADVILTDSPGAHGEELEAFRITGALLDRAPSGVQLAPCPPFQRGREVGLDALASPAFVGYAFKATLLPVQQAVLARSLGLG
ncbi:hypothetical protein GCM10025867_37850 [Frondihabitans sucicola]|uniref:N-acetyltransferase domain-containing protein n=1 Tax=Frondihabitans sucicola TaxID=1268041 RepID=A0ABM8GTB4_9MICO|nr:hypothetical protein GCM10025867_37850 [Frondihabitans sucicola]